MPHPVANQGMKFTHILAPEEAVRVKPYALMLDALLDSIIALLSENSEKLEGCIQQYDRDMKRYFGKPLVTFKVDPAVAKEK